MPYSIKLENGEEKLENGKEKIEDGKEKIEDGKEKIEDGKEKIEDGKEKIEKDADKLEKDDYKYTKEQKEYDMLMWRFSNLSKYIENIDTKNKETYWVDKFLQDYDISKINDERLVFYKELLKTLERNPKIIEKVLKINNEVKKKDEIEKEILKNFSKKFKEYQKVNNDKAANSIKYLKDDPSNSSLNDDILSQSFKKLNQRGGKPYYENYGISKDNFDKKKKETEYDIQKNIEDFKGNLNIKYDFDKINDLNTGFDGKYENNENNPIQNFIEDYYNAFYNTDDKTRNNKLKKAVNVLETSNKDVLKALKISREDRLIFIVVTFLIRYITIGFVQWCIDINIITHFYQGFMLYALIYNVFFWLIIMFVNASNAISVSYMDSSSGIGDFRSIFYYFYMGTNGISRMITHSVVIITLLLIPILININSKEDNNKKIDTFLTLDERKKLLKVLSLLSMFIWVLTSIIAIKF